MKEPLPSELAPWNNPNMRWVCEDHPTKEQSHLRIIWDGYWFKLVECGGAGMPDPKLYDHLGQPIDK
jgi:hypothetical protein